MEFFSTATANLLQHVAVPVEGIGLTLTIIEVVYPTRARAIERALHTFRAARATVLAEFLHRTVGGGEQGYLTPAGVTLSSLAIAFGIWQGITHRSWGRGIGMLLLADVVLLVAVYAAVFGARLLVKPFDQWTEGRAVGGFGLALGLAGFAMEVYQVLTLHFA